VHITNLEWREDNIAHIARHRVTPEEVEEVCFSGTSFVETAGQELYYITGQSQAGRYLFIIVKYLGHGTVKVITARDMDQKEKTRYKKRRK